MTKLKNCGVRLAKKKKKHKKKEKPLNLEEQKDFGGQQILNVNGKLIRVGDFKEVVLTSGKLELKIKSHLHKYYTNNQLDPRDQKNNTIRFIVGEKMEALSIYAGLQKSCTQEWGRIDGTFLGGKDLINISTIDAHSEFNSALKMCKPHDSILYDLIVLDQPCGRKNMDYLRECLDNLADYFNVN